MRTLGVLMTILALVAGCASPEESGSANLSSPVGNITNPTTEVSESGTVPPAEETSAQVRFSAEILMIDAETTVRMTSSWREGCPVPLKDLRLLRLAHRDFAGEAQIGEMVVAAEVAEDVVSVFERLFDSGFPIERMELVDVYGGDDLASMRADNTSAFNCRKVEGTDRWSEHAYGRAIDINPLLNPWVRGSTVSPPESVQYADRSLDIAGMIRDGDVVVEAFRDIGWTWGGTWSASKDYQHFSETGK